MKTFRNLVWNINEIENPSNQSSLEIWFKSVMDVPLEKLELSDLCRALRQRVCVEQLMPLVLDILDEDPLAGEIYDGELIAALATLKNEESMCHKEYLIRILKSINKIDINNVERDVQDEIKMINEMASKV
ncbi:hypothetical protein IBT49_15915 [Erwinia sp. S63]|uniref:contact-dependent growth inhibition system immunity protein n=1 Tax=Erwinia sp. S63 TaxID=2769341 RepID=UPI00190CE0D3|nr:contact-dependent growth inhibition system immunity protein [Erwinia sp. S63]MBK0097471.1 hypothetical protein [Erwinia sp. S63]